MGAAARRLAALLCAALLAGACTSPPAAPASQAAPLSRPDPEPTTRTSGGTLRYGIAEPSAIVPADVATPDDVLVVDALFDGLTTYDAGLSVIPAAAVSWQADEAQRVWTFALREGARFHPDPDAPQEPGPLVTAADFKFAWEQAVLDGVGGFRLELVEGYEALAQATADELSGVEVVDDLTLRVRLSAPLSTFPAVVAHPGLAPVPRELWQADEAAFRGQPVGNGPFRAAEAWVRGQFIRAQRFPGWANGLEPAHLDEVLFQISDRDTAYVAFQQGRLQISPLPEGAVQRAVDEYGRSVDGYRGPGVLLGQTPTLYFLGFNMTQPPFDDPEVRRAVSLAVDRDALVETVGQGVEAADALLAPSLPNGLSGTCAACVHDPQAARQLFAARGVTRLRLWFNRDGGHLPVARRLRDDLAAVGVVLELQAQAPDLPAYLTELAEGEVGMFRYGWTPEHAVADELLHPLFHSSQVGRTNHMRYDAPDVDELIDAARAAPGALRRVFLTRRAEDLVLNRDQAVVPLMWYRNLQVVDERVEGYRLDAMGRANLAEVRLRHP